MFRRNFQYLRTGSECSCQLCMNTTGPMHIRRYSHRHSPLPHRYSRFRRCSFRRYIYLQRSSLCICGCSHSRNKARCSRSRILRHRHHSTVCRNWSRYCRDYPDRCGRIAVFQDSTCSFCCSCMNKSLHQEQCIFCRNGCQICTDLSNMGFSHIFLHSRRVRFHTGHSLRRKCRSAGFLSSAGRLHSLLFWMNSRNLCQRVPSSMSGNRVSN